MNFPWQRPLTPVPSGEIVPTQWDMFVEWLPDWIVVIGSFVGENIMYLLLGAIIAGIMKIWVNRLALQRQQVEKLWSFVLFFLSKRQMMIPLIITLAKTQNALPEPQRKKLMAIRERCRQTPLQTKPAERFEVEKQVSKIFLDYFSYLEKNKHFDKNSDLARIVKDLEFIDSKLVTLQSMYNREAEKWNTFSRKFIGLHNRQYPFVGFRLFGTE